MLRLFCPNVFGVGTDMPASELPIQTVREGVDAEDMANAIFGDGVSVEGATYFGDIDSAGIYTNGDTVSPGVTPSDTGVILSTGNAEDFTNSSGQENQNTNTSTNTSGFNDSNLFNTAAGARTFDGSAYRRDRWAVGGAAA